MFFVAVFLHFTFLFSIFDIYFKSPIVKDVNTYKPLHEPLADRLVLFVVDGLRAESFVNYTTMSYLRSIANSHGRWGISNTQVPTESRPGHVAVFAGFYEDPSAVLKGWKENPVDFDSVFNQTAFTWCWGTYDIVEIFTKGSGSNHIFIDSLDPYDQSFSANKDTIALDSWVFERVEQFFFKAKGELALYNRLQKNKIAIFLHLLGTDTSGHTHKPKTKNFLSTIKHVDDGIKKIESIIRKFYKDDNKTAFLMTSDHGMTDWGSHGAGDLHETQTPYVLWGAGVKQVKFEDLDLETTGLSKNHRFDISQVDLTPLMSTILGISVPVNSIGQLPVTLLSMSEADKAKATCSNARQLLAQYNKKRMDVEANAISILYQPYKLLDENKYNQVIETTERLLANQEYEELTKYSREIIKLSLSGLKYYHNYYQRPLLVAVSLSFVGWILCLFRVLLEQKMNTQVNTTSLRNNKLNNRTCSMNKYLNAALLVLSLSTIYIVLVQRLPVQYIIYFTTPILTWWYALSSPVWWETYTLLKHNRKFYSVLLQFICYSGGSMTMALSFTHRWLLSVPLLGMGLWPYFSAASRQLSKPLLFLWSTGCVLLSFFSFMPVVGKDVFIELVVIAGGAWVIITCGYIWIINNGSTVNGKEIYLLLVHLTLLVAALHNIHSQQKRFEVGAEVSHLLQTLAWIITVTTLMLPLFYVRKIIVRLFAINTSILTFYLQLSVSHEGLFMFTLLISLICWICIEYKMTHKDFRNITSISFEDTLNQNEHKLRIAADRSISSEDFRRSFFFLLYIVLAFFGTGNIASLNSFEVRWVTCFTTSFQPFLITGLILLKTLAPFLSVACSFRAIQHITKAPIGYSIKIVLIYSNVMGIQLLFFVKNTGSWLEIGSSISQFVIVQVITLFIVFINQISKLLTEFSINNVNKSKDA